MVGSAEGQDSIIIELGMTHIRLIVTKTSPGIVQLTIWNEMRLPGEPYSENIC